MINKLSVKCHLSSPYLLIFPQVLMSPNIIGEFSLKPVYSSMVWKNFSKLWCSHYWKMHLGVKKLKLDIFFACPHPLPGKTARQFLVISPSCQRKITHPPWQRFFENPYTLAEKGEGNVIVNPFLKVMFQAYFLKLYGSFLWIEFTSSKLQNQYKETSYF